MVGRGKSAPQVVLGVLLVAVVVTLVLTASTSTASFSPYNSDWSGATELRSIASGSGAEVRVGHGTASYGETPPNETVAFVLSPDEEYPPEEVAHVATFVRKGGTLVVAADTGSHADQLLRVLGASARVDGRPVRDPRSNYHSPALPVATGVTNHSLVSDVDSLTLNYGTVVRPHNSTVLVNTSEYAYLDSNRNGTVDRNESLQARPVATVERIDAGRVIVVSDASVFINAMLDRPGNRQFVRAVVSGENHLLLDYSHTSGLPPLRLAVFVVRDSAWFQLGIGVMATASLAYWSRDPDLLSSTLPSAFRSRLSSVLPSPISSALPSALRSDSEADSPTDDHRASPSELADYLEREHPDWDRERVERVAEALERRR